MQRRTILGYVVAIGGSIATGLIDYNSGISIPFMIFGPAIVFAALTGGLWPGLLATLLASAISVYEIHPVHEFWIDRADDWIKLGLVLFCGTIISAGFELLHRVNETLRIKAQQRSQFLAMLAHELRNPLAPMSSSLHILQQLVPKHIQSNPAFLSCVGIMERQLSNLTRLVSDLLDVSRVLQGKIRIIKEPVELSTVIKYALEVVNTQMEVRGHQVYMTTDKEIWVEGDATRLEQCLVNILDNAAKYTKPGGHIWVTVTNGEKVVVEIKDDGIGIDSQLIEHICDPFVQADKSLDRPNGGLGMGLSLVKVLIDRHAGQFSLKSEGLQRGTTATIILPRISKPLITKDSGSRVEYGGTGTKLVVIVDDNEDTARSLAALVQLDGFRTITAFDGLQAMETVFREQPDAVFLDIGIPGLDGYQVARRLRDHGISCPLVAVTGYDDSKKCQESGFNRHIIKPVPTKILREILMCVRDGTSL
jgi:signal transduction histidine kinase